MTKDWKPDLIQSYGEIERFQSADRQELRGPMVKTSEMIERVARAMAVVDKMDEGRFEYLLPHARAAIEAMREPTEEMIFAAETHDPEDPWYTPERAWPKMIDAALSDAQASALPDDR